jgi:MFS family permease
MPEEHPDNPETEWYRNYLTKDRRLQRRMGMALFIFGTCLLPMGAAFVTAMFPRMTNILGFLGLVGFFVTFLGGPLGLMLVGWMEYMGGRQPVSLAEIERRRQLERAELFRMAQGKLPWRYSKVMLAVFAVLGLLLLIPGVILFFDPQGYRDGSLIWGLVYSVCGLLFLLLAFVVLPRQIKRLPAQSARALEARLVVGEITPGEASPEQPTDD